MLDEILILAAAADRNFFGRVLAVRIEHFLVLGTRHLLQNAAFEQVDESENCMRY